MLTVYADESTDEKEERAFSVGGVIAKQEEWDVILDKWLKITKGITFHSTDCESGYGDYEGCPRQKRLKQYASLTKLIAGENPLLGIGSAVNLKDFWKVFPNVDRDIPYLVCFQDVVVNFALNASIIIPLDDVDFVFDRTQRYKYNATLLFEKFSKMSTWRDSLRLNEIRFADKVKNPGLQVADLVARETFKHLDNQLTTPRHLPRSSVRVLAKSQRFRFRYWIKEDFERLKRDLQFFGLPENDIASYAPRGLLAWLGRFGNRP